MEPLTVIVPVYGSGPHLLKVLYALCHQTVPIKRIIVSHSGAPIPGEVISDVPEYVTFLHSDKRLYAGAARNRGLALATTPWVAFIDEDIIVCEWWHRALL